MVTLFYILAEILTVYLLLSGIGALFIWLVMGLQGYGQILLVVMLFINFFAAIKLALIGGRHSVWTGFYRPVRLLALLLPGVAALRRESTLPFVGQRQRFMFTFAGPESVTSYDVVDGLSRALSQQGISHTNAGGLRVEDGDTLWWLEPELGEPAVSGWVEAGNARHRQQIIDGVREFLEQNLRLRVVR